MHAVLTVIEGGEIGRRHVIRPGQVFLFGRGRGVTVPVRDHQVSRRHASIELISDGLYLTDLESRNGTFLGKQRLPPLERTPVADGQTIGVGESRFEVELVGGGGAAQEDARRLKAEDDQTLAEEFELLEHIGSGAMGRVWAARQKLLDERVAIKILNEVVDEESYARFLREARVCLRIRSPYVVAVHDARVVRGRCFIVMELVDGSSARDRVEEGPLPLGEALLIGEHVARALTASARAGVVHRDVKPENVFLSPDGVAKLGDFGLAKDFLADAALTKKDIGMGSLWYASPEQIVDAQRVDARADLYGLGATLYHLLAGRPPVQGEPGKERLMELMRLVTEGIPQPLGSHRPDCPAEVEELVHGLLAKAPDDRPQPAPRVANTLRRLRLKFCPDFKDPSDAFDPGATSVDRIEE